jgi:hypothetical protein
VGAGSGWASTRRAGGASDGLAWRATLLGSGGHRAKRGRRHEPTPPILQGPVEITC